MPVVKCPKSVVFSSGMYRGSSLYAVKNLSILTLIVVIRRTLALINRIEFVAVHSTLIHISLHRNYSSFRLYKKVLVLTKKAFTNIYLTGLALSRQKKKTFPPTSLHEIAGNMSTKCAFINPNSSRTSRMKN